MSRTLKYTFDQMKIDDVFEFPIEDRNKVISAAWQWGKRHGMKFKSKTVLDDQYRSIGTIKRIQ